MANEYGNYNTFNPLDPTPTTTLSDGNRVSAITGSNQNHSTTIEIPSTGKWSCQFRPSYFADGGNPMIGLVGNANLFYALYRTGGSSIITGGVGADGSYGATYGTSDYIDVLYDADADSLAFRKNGADQGVAFTSVRDRCVGPMFFGVRSSTASTFELNSGQTAFDSTIKSGYATLNTANLPTPAIINPDDHFCSVVIDHDGSDTDGTCTFNLDTYEWLAIIKNTTGAAEKWYWIDSLNGVTKYLSSDSSATQTTDSNVLTVSGTTFTLGSTLGDKDYLVEFHKAGLASAAASNEVGSINTTATSFNATSGFTMGVYEGTGANATIGTGLSTAVEFLAVKNNDAGEPWRNWHKDLTNGTYYLKFDNTTAQSVEAATWNSTAPAATVFSVGVAANLNNNSQTITYYGWHGVDGYSAFGSYEGNGVDAGPFINMNMSPRTIISKNIDNGGQNWALLTATLSTYNLREDKLSPNALHNLATLATSDDYHIYSNGYSLEYTNGMMNVNGETNIYAAWGGTPLTDGAINQGRAK